ncbi:2Fe-2S iron-sulfur cluster-binding protein [Castellaniella sp. FW104-16D08]|uniref:2Fe-2S iron-sulfur cluster-binding protein n=1 Tax=unclassified Castellaniella TaxID=2617606 RepID=UPI003315723B
MSHRVVISETRQQFDVAIEETILDAALRSGVRLPHECTFGACGTCRVKLEAGSVRYDEFPIGLTEEEAAQGYALACQAHPCSDMVISPASHGPALPDPVRTVATVKQVEALTSDISRLVLQLPEDLDLDYRAGQHMNILLAPGEERSFSMVGAYPFGNEVEFHIRRVPGGRFTQEMLSALKPDDTLQVEIPKGTFCFHAEDYRPLLFVATGTGLAPIRAMLEALLDDEDCPPVSLYWGMRTEVDLYAKDEIESWSDRLYEFNFVPVLSRATEAWQGRRGHVQQSIQEDFTDLSEYAFYLCGSPEMVTDTKRLLLSLGADLEYVYSDSFTFHHPQKTAAV